MRGGRGLTAALIVVALLTASGSALAGPVSPQVVNGRDPLPGEARALVSVSAAGLSCGGTLVDAVHVITAAHCVTSSQGVPVAPELIRVGWSSTTSRAVPTLAVVSAAVHPDYSPATFAFDMAVLELAAAIPGATPMLVASAGRSAIALAGGATVRSAGFGRTSVAGPLSNRTLVADLTVLPDKVCSRERLPYRIGDVDFYGYGKDFSAGSAVCAIGVVPDTTLIIDTCQGDSGGPLFTGTDVSARLVGIVSVGDGCAGFIGPGEEMPKKRPGIYAKTSAALSWLAAMGVDMSDSALAPPIITSAVPEPGAITVIVTPGSSSRLDTVTVSATDVATSVVDGTCVASMVSSTGTCQIVGLSGGASYSVTAVANAGDLISAPSLPVTVTLPSKPPTPRIREVYSLGGGRVEFVVVVGKAAPPDSTIVACTPRGAAKAEIAAASGSLVNGRVELRLVPGHRYTCRAISTNAVGTSRSRPEAVTL